MQNCTALCFVDLLLGMLGVVAAVVEEENEEAEADAEGEAEAAQ